MAIMDAEKYEELELLHGTDIHSWPAGLTSSARSFLSSTEGKQYLSERAEMDRLWVDSSASLDDETSFMKQLKNVPDHYTQPKSAVDIEPKGFWGSLFDMRFLMSPGGFIAQAAMGLAVMVVGVFIGSEGLLDAGVYEDSYDISSEYFASAEDSDDWVGGDDLWN